MDFLLIVLAFYGNLVKNTIGMTTDPKSGYEFLQVAQAARTIVHRVDSFHYQGCAFVTDFGGLRNTVIGI